MQNNDPSKPTCRVVKRQGQRGARIHPRGCQVRAEVDLVPAELQEEAGGRLYFPRDARYAGDFYREYTKQGKNKVFIKQSGRNMDSMFFVSVETRTQDVTTKRSTPNPLTQITIRERIHLRFS